MHISGLKGSYSSGEDKLQSDNLPEASGWGSNWRVEEALEAIWPGELRVDFHA